VNARRPFCLALALLAAALATATGCGKRPHPIVDTGLLKVTVATPKVDKVTVFTDLTGSVAAPQSVQVRPRVSGFIQEVMFKEGDMAIGPFTLLGVPYEGSPLFKIDPVTYQANLAQALGDQAVYQAKLELARADESRAKVAYDKGVTSQQDYDSYVAHTKVARASLDAALGPVIKAKQNLGWTVVRAPITGRTDKAYLTRGNVVVGGETQGTVLTTINSTDPMYVYFDVDDQTVAFYQRLFNEGALKQPDQGGKIQVDIKLLGDENYNQYGPTDYPRHGLIDFASNALNPNTGTLSIRGVFENSDHLLVPNRYVRGRVPLGKPMDNALLIPDGAVATEQDRKLVYAVGPDNKVVAKPVRLGPLSKGLRLVQSGLTKDDRIIIRGIQRVQPGEPVEPEAGTIEYPGAKP
jgi:RND family efflux transporter MFP subunit